MAPQALAAGLIAGIAAAGAAAIVGTAIGVAFLTAFVATTITTWGLAQLTDDALAEGAAFTGSASGQIRSAVSPAIWVLGEARLQGGVVWYKADGEDFYMVVALSEGPCEAITGIYIQGEKVEFTRSGSLLRAAAGSDYYNHFEVREYFAADGTEGAEIRALAGSGDLEWGANHRLNGVSYVLVKMTQNDYGDDFDKRIYRSIPRVEFVLKGLKFAVPNADGSASTPFWSANAARIRYWWMSQRRGIADADIDLPALHSAISVCAQQLVPPTSPDTRVPTRISRYEINGVITAEDDASRIEQAMDVAIAGSVLYWNGKHIVRPGAFSPVQTTITGEDILEEVAVFPGHEWTRKYNSASATLSQSRLGDFLEADIEVDDTAAQARDGRRLPGQTIRLPFVSEPIQAHNLLLGLLKEQRASMRLELLCRPRADWSLAQLRPGDVVALDLPAVGFSPPRQFRLTSSSFTEDWRLRLGLQEWAADRWTDVLELPHLRERDLAPAVHAPPAPAGLAATISQEEAEDGGIEWRIAISWEPSPYQTRLVLTGPAPQTSQLQVSGDSAVMIAKQEGAYSVEARHFSPAAGQSAAARVQVQALGLPPPAPMPLQMTQYGTLLHFVMAAIPGKTLAGLEIRYTYLPEDSTASLPPITLADWATARRMDASTTLPSVAGQPVLGNAAIQASGKYRLALRYIDRSGQLSPLTDAGEFLFILPSQESLNSQAWPEWAGRSSNSFVWLHDEGHPSIVLSSPGATADNTVDKWNGSGGWPFGAPAADSWVETESMDFGSLREGEVILSHETVQPPGVANDTANLSLSILHGASDDPAAMTSVAYTGVPVSVTARYIRARAAFTGATHYGLSRLGITARLA